MSSSSTSSFSILRFSCVNFNRLFSASRARCSSSSLPYFSSAAFARSPSLSALSASIFVWSIFSFISLIFWITSFSASQCALSTSRRDWISAASFEILPSLSFASCESSFSRACFSISSCLSFLSSSSSSIGMLSISILSLAEASSIRSMALSGRNLSVIYRFDSTAAAIRAESLTLTP